MDILSAIFGKKDKDELKKALAAGAYLVDVRTAAEFATGSATGAVNIPLGTIATQLEKFSDKQYIVLFCRSGNRSEQAKLFLLQNGIQNVINGGTWNEVNEMLNKL